MKQLKYRLRSQPKYVYCNFDMTRLRSRIATKSSRKRVTLLTQDNETVEIRRYWNRSRDSRNPIVRKLYGRRTFTLRLEDFQRLRNTDWISFNVLEFMFNKLIGQHKKTSSHTKVEYFDASLIQDIYDGRRQTWSRNLMRRKTFNPSHIGLTFLNSSHHWVLVVLVYRSRKLYIMDSLQPRSTCIAERLQHHLTEYFNRRTKLLGIAVDGEEVWNHDVIVGQRQRDSDNCGIFVIMNCKLILQNLPNFMKKDYSNAINPRRSAMLDTRLQLAKDVLFRGKGSISGYCSICSLAQKREGKVVECDRCTRWYHIRCVDLTTAPSAFQCCLCD